MIGWLLGTRIGRAASAILTAMGVIFAAWFLGKREGRKGAKTDALMNSLKVSKKAREKQDEINKASPDDVMRRLDGWMRDDDENL